MFRGWVMRGIGALGRCDGWKVEARRTKIREGEAAGLILGGGLGGGGGGGVGGSDVGAGEAGGDCEEDEDDYGNAKICQSHVCTGDFFCFRFHLIHLKSERCAVLSHSLRI